MQNMQTFRTQLFSSRANGDGHLSLLARLTRLSHTQVRVLASEQVWNVWD